jgi:hypothetical protein
MKKQIEWAAKWIAQNYSDSNFDELMQFAIDMFTRFATPAQFNEGKFRERVELEKNALARVPKYWEK